MRPIKFRAWEIKGKGWIAGFNMVNYHGYFNKGLSPNIYRYGTDWEDGEYILEQFTGLHDKNGKEIYEGDIMKNFNYKGAAYIPFYGEVVMTKLHGEMAWRLTPPYSGTPDLSLLEVVGNIHENPDLLKG